MNKILITGGTGFIGYHLARHLAQQGHQIVLADNFFRSERDIDLLSLLKRPNVKLIEVDLTSIVSWDTIGTGYDYVYHLVGINGTKLFYEIPHEVLRIGVTTVLNVINWFTAKNNKPNAKILYTSSNEAYAGALDIFNKLPIPTPENVPLVIADPYNPRWSYAGQKLIGELLFINYAKHYKFRMSIVRPHNFYGPREGYLHVIPEIIERINNRVNPFPVLGANDTRPFCYIEDAVEALQAVMESKETDSGTYHIGTREETPIKDLVEKLFSLMDWHPHKIDITNSPKGSVKHRLADVSKIKRDTGWEAKTTLEDGLRKTIEWYVAHPHKNK